MGARGRIASVVCALAVLATPLLGPAAVAETEPVFPEGVWRATGISFTDDVITAEGRVQYDGSGSLTLEGIIDGDVVNVSGELQFEALSKAKSALSLSERVYQGVWRVEGWGSTLDAFGKVAVTVLETPTGGVGPIADSFEWDGHGVLTLSDATCLYLVGEFLTEEIPLPGAITGPALYGYFMAHPDSISGENDAVFEELTELVQFLNGWIRDLHEGAPWEVGRVLERMAELISLALQLQEESVNADICGPAGRFYEGGPAFRFIADLLGDLAFIVGFANTSTPNQVSAETMIEVFGLAAAAGAFLSPDSQDIKTMNNYPLELEKLLADAIVDKQRETIDAIWAAAVQYGWESLAEKAGSAR